MRKATELELKLIRKLVSISKVPVQNYSESELIVVEMNDGVMGSLQLWPNGKAAYTRLGSQFASEIQFEDMDGIMVLATLYLDKNCTLCELDIWKVNFDKLIELPQTI